ncbi:MAG: DUF882 domain-containing protein [Pseudomonadota bacterium]
MRRDESHAPAEKLKLDTSLSRRRFLMGMTVSVAGSLFIPPTEAHAKMAHPRLLSFYNTHTAEELDIVYSPYRRFDRNSLRRLNYLLRDHRTDRAIAMDSALIDILFAISLATGSQGTFEVISGYRSPESNARLRRSSTGVAKYSLHMLGKAIDVRLRDVSTKSIRRVAIGLKRGGVGYYRSSDFVHLDTGRVRYW